MRPGLTSGGRLLSVLPNRISLLVAGVFVVCAAFLFVSAFLAIRDVDARALARQTEFALRGLQAEFDAVPKAQQGSTIWTEAVLAVRRGDQAWIEENFGPWMSEYFGFEASFILDPAGEPVYAMVEGLSRSPETFAPYGAAAAPIVTELRDRMAAASRGLADSTPAISDLGAADYRLIGGAPALVSAAPIVPSGAALQQRPGSEFIHVAVKRVDAATAGRIGAQYELEHPAIITSADAEGSAMVPLVDAAGRTLGYLAWEPYRPGLALLEQVGPPMLLAGLPLALILVLLLRGSRESAKRLADLAFRDQLTGLSNRTAFVAALEGASARAARGQSSFALLLVDIDRFKIINDTLGHAAGDEMVRQSAARLCRIAAESSVQVARLGGDEFSLLYTSPRNAEDVEDLAHRVVSEMRHPFVLDGEQVFSSVSVGVRHVVRGDALAEAALREADIALYEAKARGRSQYRLFTPELKVAMAERRTVETELRTALRTGEGLEVVYQPIFDRARTIVGAEALIRWCRPDGAMSAPSAFVPVAEDRGLIDELGQFVLDRVCQLLSRAPLPWIAVNISPMQLRLPAFVSSVEHSLRTHGIDASRLQLEITETALIDDDENSRTAIRNLAARGIVLALDDFGTGYSSLTYLINYPMAKIKLDRSFVGNIGRGGDNDAIVEAVVSLAMSMNRTVTAEGVETAEQFNRLAVLQCHELQGYFLARPLTDEELLDRLATIAGEARAVRRRPPGNALFLVADREKPAGGTTPIAG